MIGRVALRVILMESNGDDENWTTNQEDITTGEIIQGTDLLSQKATEKEVKLTWVYEIHKQVPTDYEPITDSAVPYREGFPTYNWVFNWIDDALQYLGFERDEWDGCFDMANDIRKTYHADWGYSVFVVMDENDYDHRFEDGYYAYVANYTEPTGAGARCIVIMTYNNSWNGPSAMDKVLRHETSHIFRAEDEYYKEGYGGCSLFDCRNYYGYLHVANGNCIRCNSDSADCLMLNSDNQLCDWTYGHIGWRDTDGDGPADPIDPNNGGWMSIMDVQIGDLVKIWTIDGDFVNLISVTTNNLCYGNGMPLVIWNGYNFDGQAAVSGAVYIVTVNDGEPFTRYLNPGDPQASLPYFSEVAYSNGKLSWKLNQSWANVRCFIYNQADELVCRPVWDKAYTNGNIDTLRLDLLPTSEMYSAKFYAWRPDGGASEITEFSFNHNCRGLCGDANGDGLVNVSDAVWLIDYINITGSPGPQPVLSCGDANTDRDVNISDAVWIINNLFADGPPPGDCSPGAPAWSGQDCCPFQ